MLWSLYKGSQVKIAIAKGTGGQLVRENTFVKPTTIIGLQVRKRTKYWLIGFKNLEKMQLLLEKY